MSALANLKQRLREQSEEYLRLAALDELRRRHPEGTTEPFRRSGGIFWRRVFVPVYRVLPWSLKQTAMRLLGMTAKGWTPPARRTGEPWRPPAPGPGDRRNGGT